jgi:diguanylate cyclase (GGDEF)-like protein/PAS domain S-box-containing protein
MIQKSQAKVEPVDGLVKSDGGSGAGAPTTRHPGPDQVLFEAVNEGVAVLDGERRIIAVNPAFTAITGFEAADIVGEPANMLRSERYDEAFYEDLWASVDGGGRWDGEVWMRHRDGGVFLEWLTVLVAHDDDGAGARYLAMLRGVSGRRHDDDRLLHLSNFDALTGLPSRRLLEGHLQEAMEAAKRGGGAVALICLDLDNLTTINESLGPALGDRVLMEAAEKVRRRLVPGHTLARYSGDEFMIIVPDASGEDGAGPVARDVLAAVSTAFTIEGHGDEIRLAANAGIALSDDDGDTPLELMRNAHAAAVHAKKQGRDTFLFFAERLNARVLERLGLEGRLRRAIEADELILHYQPIIDLRHGRMTGVEALVRWQDPESGLIGPSNFIPLAEETGLIGALGDWVLCAACAQARAWIDAGLPEMRMAINLSPFQLVGDAFAERVEAVLAGQELTPRTVEFEITESALTERVEDVGAQLAQLRELGVRLAVDDFGTRYASLSHLRNFAVDSIKVDGGFVADIGKREDGAKLVTAVIAIGQSFDLTVTAEGVESAVQLQFLRQHWCDQAQGFHFSRPLPAAELEALERRRRAGGGA